MLGMAFTILLTYIWKIYSIIFGDIYLLDAWLGARKEM